MSPRSLGILAALAAAIAALAAVAVYRQRIAVAPTIETGAVLPGLASKVNSATVLTVKSGEQSLTIRRDPAAPGSEWAVEELGGYPARFERVKETLVGLAMLEKVEPKTDRPESYDKLGVQEPGPGAPDSRLVTVAAGDSPLASLIVGKSTFAGSKPRVFVREPGQARSWLASGDLNISTDPMDWVDRQVLTIDSARIQMAILNHADGTQLIVSRGSKDDPWEVADMPEGRELKNSTVASPVASALAFVNMEAVRPVADIDWTGASTAEYRTFDGLMVTATTVERAAEPADGAPEDSASAGAPGDVEFWARFSADFEESLVAPVPIAQPADGHEMTEEETAAAQKAADDQRAATVERVRKEMESLNTRLGPWAIKIPKTKADQMRRRIEDLLKEAPAAEEPAPAEPEAHEPAAEPDLFEPETEEPPEPVEAPGLPPPGEPRPKDDSDAGPDRA